MTQEDKELLLKDLCARLPYGVKCKVVKRDIDGEMLFIRNELDLTVGNVKELVTNNMYEIKPYLFPLSSMTEEQSKKSLFTKHKITRSSGKVMYLDSPNTINYYLKNHFDYRGLIEKGLAIDAINLNIY